jgi:hypothetical protein
MLGLKVIAKMVFGPPQCDDRAQQIFPQFVGIFTQHNGELVAGFTEKSQYQAFTPHARDGQCSNYRFYTLDRLKAAIDVLLEACVSNKGKDYSRELSSLQEGLAHLKTAQRNQVEHYPAVPKNSASSSSGQWPAHQP